MAYDDLTATTKMRLWFAHGVGTYLSKALAEAKSKDFEEALKEARAEGFRAAKERAADACDAYAAMMHSLGRDDRAEGVEKVSDDIRAMEDDAGEGQCVDASCSQCRRGEPCH